jgi:hypothetical protein
MKRILYSSVALAAVVSVAQADSGPIVLEETALDSVTAGTLNPATAEVAAKQAALAKTIARKIALAKAIAARKMAVAKALARKRALETAARKALNAKIAAQKLDKVTTGTNATVVTTKTVAINTGPGVAHASSSTTVTSSGGVTHTSIESLAKGTQPSVDVAITKATPAEVSKLLATTLPADLAKLAKLPAGTLPQAGSQSVSKH